MPSISASISPVFFLTRSTGAGCHISFLGPSLFRLPILLIALAPFGYYIAGILAAARFFRRERAKKLPVFTPPVSLLKPVRGVDFASRENFSSFCNQDYPDYEILFCVNDLSDPAVPLIEQLM